MEVSGLADQENEAAEQMDDAPVESVFQSESQGHKNLDDKVGGYKSFLTENIIQHLQRGLDWQQIDAEFNKKVVIWQMTPFEMTVYLYYYKFINLKIYSFQRQIALIEAMRSPNLCDPSKGKVPAENSSNMWVTVPRSFTRRSSRFELPMDSRKLKSMILIWIVSDHIDLIISNLISAAMAPLEYARELVQVSSGRKLLYGEIFNKHSEDSGIENESKSIQLQVI